MLVLFVFVDGLGIGPPGLDNPLSALEEGPLSLLGGGPPRGAPFRILAADASLGVSGPPQSATGGGRCSPARTRPPSWAATSRGCPTGRSVN